MAAETMRITEELVVNDRTGPGSDSATRRVSAFDRTVQETQNRLNKMSGSRWNVTFGAIDKATSIITGVEDRISRGVGKAWNFTVGLIDKVTSPLQSIFNLLRNPILQAGAVLGVSISVSDAISTFGGFESAMSQVKAISGASGEDMEQLTALAKEMGSTTKFTAEEAAQGLTYMAMAGWKTQDMMTSLSGVMNLAAASGEDLATVSDIVTDAMTAFGLAADGVTASGVANATHFSDVLAAASSNANTTVSGMGETFKYVGSMAGALGYNIEDVALATGLMANSGIKGTMAGTALNSMLTRLSTNTSGAADAISALGVEFYNADGSARNLGDVMGELRRATVNMTAAQKSELANTVAGTEAQKGLLAILNTSEEDYNSLAEAIYNADGAAQQMSETMLDNMQGSMTLLQSAVDGVKLSLGSRLSPYVRQFADWLTTKMPAVETVINNVMDTIDSKIEALKGTIDEFTSSDEWASADIWGKISIAWDKIVAEPFAAWWDGTGKPWLQEKVSSFGETLGSGITAGLLAILGFDASGAVEDGKTIGSSFIEGFKEGFDTEQIGAAITEWANDHKGVIAAAGVIAAGKLIGGISKGIQTGKNIFNDLSSLFGGSKGSGAASTAMEAITGGARYVTSTMTVTAGTVIVYGSNVADTGRMAKTAVEMVERGAAQAAITEGAKTAGRALLTTGGTEAAKTAGQFLLTDGAATATGAAATAAGGAATAGKATAAFAAQAGAAAPLAELGVSLGSGASTAAGAAAVGAGSIAGAVGGLLGLGSAAIDLFQGIGKSKEGDKKGAKDEYVTAGTKTGMVGAGAAAGAAIGAAFGGVGAVPGALIGAGIGGIGALLGGNKAGKAISDSTDEGGFLNKAGKAVGGFFTDTLPNFVTETIPSMASTVGTAVGGFATRVGGAVGGFFTDTVPNFFTQTIPAAASRAGTAISGFATRVGDTIGNFFTDTVPTFLTEQVPYAAGYVMGRAYTFFGQTVPAFFGNLWDSVSTFFTSTLPTWASGVFESAATFFTETVPEFFGGLWDNVATFFTETIPTWAGNVYQRAATFFTETIPAFFGGLWDNVYSFMTQTVPAWASSAFQTAATFFGETVPAFVGNLWNTVSGFFTQTLPAWADSAFQRAATFFGDTVPTFFGNLWNTVTGFVTETIPAWASAAYDTAATFFGSTVPSFFSSLWSSISGFVTETIPGWASSIASMVGGWWSSISGWFSQIWDSVSGAFSQGFSAGAGTGAHAEGGIMNAPHTARVAEDGPEAIIPLGTGDRARGRAVWEQAGDILGVDQPQPVGSNDDRTTDGSPVPVSIPVGSNDDGTGTTGGVFAPPPIGSNDDGSGAGTGTGSNDDGGGARIGSTDDGTHGGEIYGPEEGQSGPQTAADIQDVPVYSPEVQTPTEAQRAAQGGPVSVPVSITINPEIIIQAAQGMNEEDIVQILKERIRELVDDISDEMAERLARIFANMPLKGGA